MDTKKISCLIIEDEEEFQKILEFYLSKVGIFEILGAYQDTVKSAIQIEKQKPDVIFLDINISGLDGPELLDLIEHQPKVVIVSGHSEEFMKSRYDVSYDAYIQKPVTAEKLKAAIAQIKG